MNTNYLFSFIPAITLTASIILTTPFVLAANSTNTANCNLAQFSVVPVPEDALSISIDSASLVAPLGSVPEHCHVKGHILTSQPVSPTDNGILFEVKMPTVSNNKFLMHGNGGFAGRISNAYTKIATPDVDGDTFPNGYGLDRGYTIAATDTGHVGTSNIDATGFLNPDGSQNVDRIINYGYKSVHLTVVTTKNLMKAYYGKKPKYSYIMSLSNGGRQGLVSVNRYPSDFDGVIAGAPAWNLVDILAKLISDQQAQYPAYPPLTPVISPAVAANISAAAMLKCDAADGVVDNIISDPLTCNFDPVVDVPGLTAQQLNTLTTMYNPLIVNNKKIIDGFLPGYETGSDNLPYEFGFGSPNTFGLNIPTINYAFAIGTLRYLTYVDPSYILNNFNLQTNLQDLYISPSGVNLKQISHADTDVNKFVSKGGKIIVVHGLADWIIPAPNSIKYYKAVDKNRDNKKEIDSFLRLYLVPGLFHFNAFGTGHDPNAPTHMKVLEALENWVEKGKAPKELIASRINASNQVDMTRPICPYPQIAKLKNGLDATDPAITNNASNFKCVPSQKNDKHDDNHD